ncbi:SDR family oxidoreductase [Bergeriella denitrificans]|uniref:Short chain dehydrogenase n=1 Tax=Bergeriella denitrificans TaxID=494 RepID=A0A378UEX1_BERDE|nr:SDR family oxidoreductase [Bergeriella denitrificans]STZ75886.1 short chain dehydrogenase [Bergeriella denitrificans]
MSALANKVIMVTGASQGLGEQVAKAYAEAGATVILVSRRQKRMEKVYDEIVAAGHPEPFAICFDLLTAEDKEFEQFAATIAEATQGKLDGIVHCASYFNALSPLDFQSVADWVKLYRINTVAPMGLTRALFPLLKESPDASVIFVGESHGETPKAYWGGFGASKSALNYLCKVVADEWERFPNLRANVLVPGAINSPQRIKSHPGEAATERKSYADVVPQFVWWASEAGKGRSGEIVYL